MNEDTAERKPARRSGLRNLADPVGGLREMLRVVRRRAVVLEFVRPPKGPVGTAYRQLISKNGAAMKLGDRVLIWGASGGLGSYATQYALNGGAIPVCVVSSR